MENQYFQQILDGTTVDKDFVVETLRRKFGRLPDVKFVLGCLVYVFGECEFHFWNKGIIDHREVLVCCRYILNGKEHSGYWNY